MQEHSKDYDIFIHLDRSQARIRQTPQASPLMGV